MTEVPEDFYNKEVSYIYYLIFYPNNKSAKHGKAVIRVLHAQWNKWVGRLHCTYMYEIRNDNVVELYNGHFKYDTGRGNDIRLSIEKEDGIIQLRGYYRNEERLFKRTEYIDAVNKENDRI